MTKKFAFNECDLTYVESARETSFDCLLLVAAAVVSVAVVVAVAAAVVGSLDSSSDLVAQVSVGCLLDLRSCNLRKSRGALHYCTCCTVLRG